MKLLAKADIIFAAKKFKAGTVFETDENTAGLLLEYGWAEVVEEVKAPKAEAEKATKKKK